MFRTLGKLARARPRGFALGALLLLVAASAGAVYGYALREWRAAEAALEGGQVAEARERLGVCLKVWPRSVEVHLLAARAARLSGEFSTAEGHLKTCKALQKGESSEAIQLEYLLIRAQTGEVDDPLVNGPLFKLVEAKHPEGPAILETIARAYMRDLNYGKAFACLNRWIEEEPTRARPYHWRGWVVERLNNPKAAQKDYEKALELDPSQAAVRLRIAEMLLEDKLPREALPHLERLMREHPDRADVMARMGQCRFLQGDRKEARRLLEAAREKMPNDGPLLVHLARLDMLEGKAKEAEGHLRHLIAADPGDTEAWFTLVAALQGQKRGEEAAAALKHYQKLKAALDEANKLLSDDARKPTNDPGAAARIGTVLLELGHERLGLHWLNEALRRDPTYRAAHRALAQHYEKKGDAGQAARHRARLAGAGEKGER